jgi:hypothetical protein
MQRHQKIISGLVLGISVFLSSLVPFSPFVSLAHAQTVAWEEGVCVENGVATIQGLQCLVGNILSVVVSAIGLAGFVMIIVGAFRYLLSGGNSKGTEEGKQTITFAVGGIVVALSAFIILQLIANFTGVKTILNFRIPSSNDGLGAHEGLQINE